MAAVAKKHKTATIFISAHSLEYPSSVIKASDIEVRVLNSQLVCGRHNFESAESIRNKLDYWTTLFHFSKHDKKKQKKQKKKKEKEPPYSTYQLLEQGKNAFNDQIVPRQSIAST